ncbi:VOC family protein [Aurantibacter crassamenti]|uniref:VOC family protein n=1 Tax=Aurantibacter crassamenti TaxID=1837375 RepID=UPI00193A66FE|nr:VOC family protein [Aurantibacter crassamenti]MBM1106949.1 VOC family protein [Aurantibacter crassamenti]
MLKEPTITAFLPTSKTEQSKQFYINTLGLKLVSENIYALEFEGKGAFLRITVVEKFNPHPFTVLGFKIKEIESQVKSLNKKGVKFERYNYFDQDELGIWIAPSKAKIAWFKDPDGNLISLTEYDKD